MRYFANFSGDEIDGKVYQEGDEITGVDPGTLAFLTSNGRITERPDDDGGEGSSLGGGGVNTGLTDRKVVDEMRRPELLAEARRHFDTMIGSADDDQLRGMVASARSAIDDGRSLLDDPARRDASLSNSDSFVPASIVAQNVDDVVAKLDGLSADQLRDVLEAEKARPGGARKGVTDAIDARLTA